MVCNPKKITKNPSKIFQNPPQTHLRKKMRPRHTPKSTFGSSWMLFGDFWRAPGAAFWIFNDFEPSKMVPKSTRNLQNTLKSQRSKQIYFRMRFCVEFSLNLWARNLKNSNFPYEKQRFSENRRFLKNLPTIDFYFHFDPGKPPKIAPKSFQYRKKSHLKTKIRVNMRVCN